MTFFSANSTTSLLSRVLAYDHLGCVDSKVKIAPSIFLEVKLYRAFELFHSIYWSEFAIIRGFLLLM